MKLKITAATATAPMKAGSGSRPTTAVSTAPSSGTVTLETMIGPAMRQTRAWGPRTRGGGPAASGAVMAEDSDGAVLGGTRLYPSPARRAKP